MFRVNRLQPLDPTQDRIQPCAGQRRLCPVDIVFLNLCNTRQRIGIARVFIQHSAVAVQRISTTPSRQPVGIIMYPAFGQQPLEHGVPVPPIFEERQTGLRIPRFPILGVNFQKLFNRIPVLAVTDFLPGKAASRLRRILAFRECLQIQVCPLAALAAFSPLPE